MSRWYRLALKIWPFQQIKTNSAIVWIQFYMLSNSWFYYFVAWEIPNRYLHAHIHSFIVLCFYFFHCIIIYYYDIFRLWLIILLTLRFCLYLKGFTVSRNVEFYTLALHFGNCIGILLCLCLCWYVHDPYLPYRLAQNLRYKWLIKRHAKG